MEIKNWVDSRKLEPRWGLFVSGIVNVTVMLAAFLILWRVFMDPRGLFKMYTPMYGYAYVQWFLIAVLMIQLVFKYWPLQNSSFLAEKHPLLKGLTLYALSAVFVLFMVDFVFKTVIGNLAIPYFSEEMLLSLKQNAFNAREYSHQAILQFAGLAALLVPIWVLHLNNWPAGEIKRGSGYITSFLLIMFMGTVGFLILYHPNICVLFYPWQDFAAAVPWWDKFANTLSGNFILGIMMSWTATLWITQVTFEGYPYKLIQKQPWRALAGILGTLVFGLILFEGFHFLQDIVWGPPVRGAALMAAVDWRYLHSGETSMFMLMVALIWGFYFKNWPKQYSTEVNILIRVAIVSVGTLLFYLFYYRFNPVLLGTQQGYSNPMQYPLAATTLIVALLLSHSWFLDMWPGERALLSPDMIQQDAIKIEQVTSSTT